MTIKIKRIYDNSKSTDGKRILVDRIWPRGVSKEKANLDEWLKEIAPSKELRQWFNHEEDKYSSFEEKYIKELSSGEQKKSYDCLIEIVKEHDDVTLLYAAKDKKHNQAVVLKKQLEKSLPSKTK